mmetsp:Transcript_84087/g.116172  ORF Transcript_84087/g.116172 Transcript_84087/m.116172 type:complete len:90 (-) Transcript_84087:5722-5991(-)
MYTQMMPAMLRMFVLEDIDMNDFWRQGYEMTNFYDYSIYDDDYQEAEFFEQFDEIEGLQDYISASYMGEILSEEYMMDVYLFLDQEIHS